MDNRDSMIKVDENINIGIRVIWLNLMLKIEIKKK